MASQVGHSCWESAWGRFTMLWLVVAGFLSGLVGVHGMTSRSHKSGRPDLRPVYIGGLFPNASVLFPSIESAVRDINNFPSILPNHRLQFMLSETAECDVVRGFQKYLDFIDTLPRKLLLLTGLCTEIIRTVDRDSRNSGATARTLQVSYANSDSTFDATFQSSLFRLHPTETTFNYPRTQLILEFISKSNSHLGIGLIYQNSPKYFIPHEEQVAQLLRENIAGGLESEGFEETASENDVRAVLHRLKEKNVNILVGNFNATRATQILCLAYREKMYGDKYTWLLAGDYESSWWRKDDDGECFPHEMERVMDGMIRIDILPFHGNSLDMKFPEHRSFHQNNRNSKFDGYVYDAVWAMAYALHNISHFYAKVSQGTPHNPRDDYLTNTTISFQNPAWEEALHRSLSAVSFLGVTGRVSFDKKLGRVGYSLLVKQFQSLGSGYDEVNVGEYESISSKLNFVKYPHRLNRRRSQILSSKSEFEEIQNEPSTEYGDHPAGVTGRTSNINRNQALFLPTMVSVVLFTIVSRTHLLV